jgi:hypothetical protein
LKEYDENGMPLQEAVPYRFEETLVAKLISTYRKSSSLEGQQILREAYDQSYGIFDYTRQAHIERSTSNKSLYRPLSSVAIHYAEDVVGTDEMASVIEQFGRLRIYERFGLDLIQYLSLPREMFRVVRKQAEEHMQEADKIQTALKAQIDGMGTPKK